MCTPPLEAQYGAVQTFFLETKPWIAEIEQTGQVGIDHVRPLLIGHGRRVTGAAGTAGVDQDIDLAKVRDHILHTLGNGLGVAQVEVVGVNLHAVLLGDLLRIFLQVVGAARHEGDVGTGVGHCLCELQAETGAAAGNQSDLPGQIKNVVFHGIVSFFGIFFGIFQNRFFVSMCQNSHARAKASRLASSMVPPRTASPA